ncbi:AAA family ATPase [Pseudochelatococcus sp. G4_1912]|uniref:AAA family ATPase n=1 Tax=Pseudochelatococcus sp. G4_1912 TaxID=3114288 RepID=UPI0039C7029B
MSEISIAMPQDPPRQLPLDLPVDTRLEAEDFLVGPANTHAYAMIESWPAWPDTLLRLIGPEGSGKTHLASIWAQRAGASVVSIADVTTDKVEALAAQNALVIEDADQMPRDEHALFHLLNVMRRKNASSGASMLITARTKPEEWGLVTPDLLSRLRLSPSVAIDAPDDALLRAVLVKLFVDRQLLVDTSVVEALGRRMERSLAAAGALVEMLDREALSHSRRITRVFALSMLDRWEEEQHSQKDTEQG